MRYKFKCPECSEVIYTNYLKIGEYTKCQHCGSRVAIPTDAVETDENADYDRADRDREVKHDKIDPFERFPRMNIIVSAAQAVGWGIAILVVFMGVYAILTTGNPEGSTAITGTLSYVLTGSIVIIVTYGAIEVVKVLLSMEKNTHDLILMIHELKDKGK